MKQFLLTLILLLAVLIGQALQLDSLGSGVRCAGKPADLKIYYHSDENFDSANRFVVELSNGRGEFIQADTLGIFNSDQTSGVLLILDFTIDKGYGDYMIRIRSSAPYRISNALLLNFTRRPSLSFFGRDPLTGEHKAVGFCAGDSLRLSISGFSSPFSRWFLNGNPLPFDSGSHNVAILVKGPGHFKFIDSGSCFIDSIETTIFEQPQRPEAALTSSGSTCEGGDLQLKVAFQPGCTYQWYFNNTLLSLSGTNCAPDIAGTYRVLVTSGPGCDASASQFVALTAGKEVRATIQNTGLADKTIHQNLVAVPGACWGVMRSWADPYETALNKPITRTLEGNSSWSFFDIPDATGFVPTQITAVDSLTAWVSLWKSNGKLSRIYKTTDGGKNWNRQCSTCFTGLTSYINGIHFFNANEGTAFGDPDNGYFEIYTTVNGGNTWSRVPSNAIDAVADAFAYTSKDIYCNNAIGFNTFNNKLVVSTDKGLHWKNIPIPVVYVGPMVMLDSANWLVSGDNGTGSGNKLYRTRDQGQSFTPVPSRGISLSGGLVKGPADMIFGFVDLFDGNGILMSRDDGQTWHLISDTRDNPVYSLSFFGTKGYAGTLNNNATQGGALLLACDTLVIRSDKDTLGCNDSTLAFTNSPGNYQWMLNNAAVPGQIQSSIRIKNTGTWRLKKIVGSGCPVWSNELHLSSSRPAPLTISGENKVQPGVARLYSAPYISGHTYNWQVSGGTIVGLDTPNKCIIQWGASGTGLVRLLEKNTNNCSGDTNVLPVFISPSPNDTLLLNRDTLRFAWNGITTDSFFIQTKTAWNITPINTPWLHLSAVSGNGSKWIRCATDTNYALQREVSLLISISGLAYPLEVVQENLPLPDQIQANRDTISFSNKLNDTLILSSTLPWQILQIPSWLHVSPSSGKGYAQVALRVDPLFAATVREEVLLLTTAASPFDKQVYVVQSNNSGIVQTEAEATIQCYPNPASSILFVNDPQKTVTRIRFYQPDGKFVFEEHIGDRKSINLESLNPGLYFILLETASDFLLKKIQVVAP